jgi:hypothetical protein
MKVAIGIVIRRPEFEVIEFRKVKNVTCVSVISNLFALKDKSFVAYNRKD